MIPSDDFPLTDPALWLSEQPITITVRGISMAPFLREGDRVEVARVEPASLKRGDLVVFLRGREVVVHRFLLVRGDRFLEKGDSQPLGNWSEWPVAVGRVLALRRDNERTDLSAPPWPRRMASLGGKQLRGHRIGLLAQRLPGAFARRVCLGVCRRMGLL